jgi:hypothetical protein
MKDSNDGSNKKSIILTVVLLLILVVTVVGVTFAVFSFSQTGTKTNTISTGSIQCSFVEGDPISITAAQPISDTVGKTLAAGSIAGYTAGYYDSTISCTCNGTCSGNYELYLKNTSTAPALDTSYVKTYLTDGATTETQLNAVTLYSALTTATADAAGKRIYQKSFTGTFTQKHRLRVWVADTYPVTGTSNNFSAKIYAKVSA